MKKAYVVTGTIIVLSAIGTQACTLGSDTYITAEADDTSTGEKKDAGAKTDASVTPTSPPAAGSSCSGSFEKPDIAKLTACGNGKGHCYDKAKTPSAAMLGPCSDASQVCVPDEVLGAAGNTLKQCESGVGSGGGCITMALIPAMEADPRAKAFLKQSTCDSGQVCAPCINPEANNAPTGFCEAAGVYGECSSGGAAPPPPTPDAGASKPMPACCSHGNTSNGVCIGESVIPEAQRSEAPQDSCSSGNKCVPKDMFEGKPVLCNSGLLGKGICLDTCFNEMMGFASMIGIFGKDRCEDTEVCVPCTFMSGKGITACD